MVTQQVTFKKQHIRAFVMIALFLIIIAVFLLRLVQIQITDGQMYRDLVDQGDIKQVSIKATRGEIYDRNGVPLVKNSVGYTVVLDRAYISRKNLNTTSWQLIELLEQRNESWEDNLPISFTQPVAFLSDRENDVTRLKNFLELQPYATAADCMHALIELYELEGYTAEEARKIAGVRYEMTRQGFSLTAPYTFSQEISEQTALMLEENSSNLPGVSVQEIPVREYVLGDVAPHILGTIGPMYAEDWEILKDEGYNLDDYIGKSGIEYAMEDKLRGENGIREIVLDSAGNVIESKDSIKPTAGKSIYLTIDANLQIAAQNALEKQIKWLQENAEAGKGKEARAGAAVAVNVKTGEVLAAANYPSYDLSTYSQNYNSLIQDELLPLYNRAFLGLYAPGSCFKPVTATASMTAGLIDGKTTVLCDHVYTYFSDYQPTCMGWHGNITVISALKYSCNLFFYDTGRQIGDKRLAEYAKQYGLGEKTGVEITEYRGKMASKEQRESEGGIWNPGDILQASIGQSDSQFTPIQLAMYTATIANNGIRNKATLIHKITSYDGREIVREVNPIVLSRVDAEQDVFDVIEKGMVAASRESGGTAYRYFGNYPVTVASKTGTPQVYGNETPNSVFICYAPAEDPEIAVICVIERGNQGTTSAPVAKDILDAYFGFNTVLEEGDASDSSATESDESVEIEAESENE